jgi:hypothetical protein
LRAGGGGFKIASRLFTRDGRAIVEGVASPSRATAGRESADDQSRTVTAIDALTADAS